jgi:hypothetical protein
MRGRTLLLCVGIVVVAAAWKAPKSQGTPPKKVLIRFSCENDGGATVTVRPWRVVLGKRTDQVEWSLVPSGIASVSIAPKYIASWPFVAPPPIIVTAAKPGVGKDIPPTVPAGNYKYTITGVCTREGMPPDTVVIDPDMIIPTLTTGT